MPLPEAQLSRLIQHKKEIIARAQVDELLAKLIEINLISDRDVEEIKTKVGKAL